MSPLNIANPATGDKTDRLIVPCGRCGQCYATKRNEWTFKLSQEEKTSLGTFFITLTYSDENLEYTENGNPTLNKKTISNAIKLLRKQQQRDKTLAKMYHKKSLRYYIVGEYGTTTDRPHYHAILFNCHISTTHRLIDTWKHGTIDIQPISPANIHYITKLHINKHHEQHKIKNNHRQKPFSLMSTVPPLGTESILKNKKWAQDNNNFYLIQNGQPVKMPRYFRNKYFDKYQQEQQNIKQQIITEDNFDKQITKLEKNKNPLHPEIQLGKNLEQQSKTIIEQATKGTKI